LPRRQAVPVRLWGIRLRRRRHPPGDLLISHVSINFDRAGWQRDINVVYSIDRLASGEIGGVADTHYTVMGSTDPAATDEAVNNARKTVGGGSSCLRRGWGALS
jgi:hypothetical protein